MALFRVFRTPKHQKFDYKTRFFDPEKEELQNRIKTYSMEKSEDDFDVDLASKRITAGFRRKGYGVDASYRSQQVKKSNLRLIAIVVVLCMLTYLLLVYMPKFALLMK